MTPLKHARTDVLYFAYHVGGPIAGQPIVTLHGYPYDVHSYAVVAPRLDALGYRVVVPYLRGHDSVPRPAATVPVSRRLSGRISSACSTPSTFPRRCWPATTWGGRAACASMPHSAPSGYRDSSVSTDT